MNTYPQIIRINKHQFFTESHTTTGVFYKLEWSRNQRRFLCSCMDSTCRKHECKHGQSVRQFFQNIINQKKSPVNSAYRGGEETRNEMV